MGDRKGKREGRGEGGTEGGHGERERGQCGRRGKTERRECVCVAVNVCGSEKGRKGKRGRHFQADSREP